MLSVSPLSATPSVRESDHSQAIFRTSPSPASPRPSQKRLRNGDSVRTNGAVLSGYQTPTQQESSNSTRKSRLLPDASIVLVGIRGSGKRSLGFIAAAALGRRFITEDHYFLSLTGLSRQDYLRIHGSEDFHKQDVDISRQMLEENKYGCVIDCGLGSLTHALQEYLKTYCQTNLVIYVQRDMIHIKRLLKLSDRSTKMLENGDPSHRKCSNFEFFNLEDESGTDMDNEDDRASPTYSFKLREAQTDFSAFVRVVTNAPSPGLSSTVSAFTSNAPIESKLFTHVLVLPVSVYRQGHLNFPALEAGGDVAGVGIDEWQEGTARLITQMIAEVRRRLRVPVMVFATSIKDNFPINIYFAALRHALRCAPEFLVVDLSLEKTWIAELASHSTSTRLIGSIRYPKAEDFDRESDQVISQLQKALTLEIKLVSMTAHAVTRMDGERFEHMVRALRHRYISRLHFSAYLTGPFGRTSQVFNPVLTFVTHKSLNVDVRSPNVAIPNITAIEALSGLFSSFTLDPLHFFVFGANVSNSLSPMMHNEAYKVVGLPHDYHAVNVESWDDIKTRAKAFDFGAASIAQPWKVKIVSQLANMSEHARAIGAINTLVPLRGDDGQRKEADDQALYRNRAGTVFGFYGDNSDWVSIQVQLNKNLSPRNVIHSKTTSLIIGAGGMARAACYALLQMGCRNIFIYNRTISNANILADHFQEWSGSQNLKIPAHIHVIETTSEPWPEGYAQPTIIISCVTQERLPGEEHVADFTVPEQWLGSETGGTAVEQAYYMSTPFVEQIKKFHATTGKPWVVVDGLEVLHEQGVAQFEIMTGRKPPRTVMWNVIQKAIEQQGGKV